MVGIKILQINFKRDSVCSHLTNRLIKQSPFTEKKNSKLKKTSNLHYGSFSTINFKNLHTKAGNHMFLLFDPLSTMTI